MSLFGAYAFSEDSFNSASLSVTVEVTGASATTAFNNSGIFVRTGSTFNVTQSANYTATTILNNDDTEFKGGALFSVDCSDPAFEAVTAAGSLSSMYTVIFAMTPTVYAAYPKTITGDSHIVGESNESRVSAILSNHMEYVINERPGVYDGGIVDSSYKGLAIDRALVTWIVYQDRLEPFPICVGNLNASDNNPVGLKPRGSPTSEDITLLQTYYTDPNSLTDAVKQRVRQLIWGVPNELIEDERFYNVVENGDTQTFTEDTPSTSNTYNDLVL